VSKIVKRSARDLGYSLLGPDHLPIGDEEIALRTADGGGPRRWRDLKSGEIEQLGRQGNWAADWGSVMVCEPFHPALIQRCRFYGLVRMGEMGNLALRVDGAYLPVGLYDSTLISCDLGSNVAIDRVGSLAHAIVGDEAVLVGVGRVMTTRQAVFGNGLARDGKDDASRCWIAVGNEAGGRAVLPFDGMLVADAWLWSRHRDDARLMERLRALTDAWADARPGHYSRIDYQAVVRDARALIDVRIGPYARVEGADRLENVTLLSDAEEPCHVAEGAVAIDGIAGYGCRLGHGVQARRFVLGTRARLESGARLSHVVLGDNSTVACCEVLHDLIFPLHEQHHNNSFLIAATLEGQSNVAAGVTLGSNHNSRAPDGEVLAERGFWPGLCANFKHNCRFAAYTLVVKGNYPAELNVPLPFSLLSPGDGNEGLKLFPAWWFIHNMYAVGRNQWKFRARDKRVHAGQHIVTEALAPDTVEEILTALELLERWTGLALLRQKAIGGKDPANEAAQARGRQLLLEAPDQADALEILADGIENSRRPTRVLKAGGAYAIYREMAHHYAVCTLVEFMEERQVASVRALAPLLTLDRERRWANLGGQLVPGAELERLRQAIASGAITTWQGVHAEYDRLWREYPEARARHAGAVALALNGLAPAQLDEEVWRDWLRRALATQEKIADLAQRSRAKDHTQPFRQITFASAAEREAVLGRLEDDDFLTRVREETEALRRRIEPFLR
jgi:hypothetical protein